MYEKLISELDNFDDMPTAIEFISTEALRHVSAPPKQEEPAHETKYPSTHWGVVSAGINLTLMLIMIFCK